MAALPDPESALAESEAARAVERALLKHVAHADVRVEGARLRRRPAPLVPLVGRATDKVGRRPMYAAGAFLGIFWAFIAFPMFDTDNSFIILAAITIGLMIHALDGEGDDGAHQIRFWSISCSGRLVRPVLFGESLTRLSQSYQPSVPPVAGPPET